MIATALLTAQSGLEWSEGVKIFLIVLASIVLAAAVALLIVEIVGKKSLNKSEAAQQPEQTAEQAAAQQEAPVEEPEPEPLEKDEILLEDNAVLVDDGTDADSGVVIVGETEMRVRYNRSFTAKLIQSDDVVKGRYSELRNELMRYELKSRISWSNDTYYKGRVTYAKFAIRGKTLSLYLALDPKEFAETKYIYEDAGEVGKYKKTPMRLKLKSDRSVRWAKELIAIMAAKYELQFVGKDEQDFKPPYEETQPLVQRRLIKLYKAGEIVIASKEKPDLEIAAVEAPLEKDEILLEDNAVLVDDGADADSGVVIVGETEMRVRYNRSFTAKLIQSDDVVKGRYSELRNELMRYELKSRISWSNDTYYKGRVTYAKFAIRGKTLSLYLALDPKEFAETKYIYEDAGEVGKYKKTPMRLKLKSDRSVRWAKELIAIMAAKYGLQFVGKDEQDFKPPYEETQPLVQRRLIKLYKAGKLVIPPKQVKDEQPPEQVDPQSEIVATVDEPTEEATLTEEATQEITETPTEIVAEETETEKEEDQPSEPEQEPEQEQEIEPEPAEELPERDFEILDEVSATDAASMISDQKAEELIEVKTEHVKSYVKPTKKTKGIVNISALGAAFGAGERVTLEKLIDKKLVAKRVTFVKVLADGTLNKPLVVEADDFSIEAVKMIVLTGGRAINKKYE